MDKTFEEHLESHVQTVLFGTYLYYTVMLVGVALNTFQFISEDRFNPFLNGLVLVVLTFGALFSLTALSFETLIKKTVLPYHLTSLFLKVVVFALFVTLDMLNRATWIHVLIIALFYIGSFVFDKTAKMQLEKYDEAKLKQMVIADASMMDSSEFHAVRKALRFIYRMLFVGFIYVFVVYDRGPLFQIVTLLIVLLVVGFHHIKYHKENYIPPLFLIGHALYLTAILVIQLLIQQYELIEWQWFHLFMFLLAYIVMILYAFYLNTRFKNHIQRMQVDRETDV